MQVIELTLRNHFFNFLKDKGLFLELTLVEGSSALELDASVHHQVIEGEPYLQGETHGSGTTTTYGKRYGT